MSFQPPQQAQNEFWRQHRAGTLRTLLSRLSCQPGRLSSFDDARGGTPVTLGPRTLREVPLRRVVGSVGRSRDYTRDFRPLCAGDGARWVRVRRAVETSGLPPVELYRLSDDDVVQDGHHRVSVLRSLGVETAEAYVTELRAQARGDAHGPVGVAVDQPKGCAT